MFELIILQARREPTHDEVFLKYKAKSDRMKNDIVFYQEGKEKFRIPWYFRGKRITKRTKTVIFNCNTYGVKWL